MRRSVSGMLVSKIYVEGGKIFGITPREYYAVIADKKIKSGSCANDDRQIYKLFSLLEKAERIDKSSQTAKNEAATLLSEAKQALEKIINSENRNNYNAIYDDLKTRMQPILTS
jgi:hypothetical protein